jgi:hypothetical protein
MADMVIDIVRASKDGHQFHEAWLARCALALLLPRDTLYAIAVEGLAEADEEDVSEATVEIADATFYFGSAASFEACARMEMAQFKYSIAACDKPLRVADARKTLVKFAAAEADFNGKHGAVTVSAKMTYSLNTNRPISTGMLEAFRAASKGEAPASGDGKAQLDQLRATVPLTGDQLRSFASRVVLVGRMENLRDLERGNARTIADWSASDDVLARARLGDLRQMMRDKAGSAGQRNNLVKQVDVLAALGLAEETDLLPTPQAFPEVGEVVKRAQLATFIGDIGNAPRWMVHAAGGIGKTVFVQSLAAQLEAEDEVVLFDCFGGGAYRTLADGRHKPERGLLHIVNELACRGLCDPILPGTSDSAEVVRRSLQRFRQVIEVVRRTRPGGCLFIIIDAADNAGLEAARRGQPSFPRELLESLSAQGPVDGLFVIATARTERCDKAIGNAECRSFPLTPFTLAETEAYISARRPDASVMQMQVVHRRADGNPRVIANLIEPDRNLVGETQTEAKVELESLIQQRIDRAVKLADEKGANADAVSAFLCALSILPPPVPIDEIAMAFGIPSAEVESFAADLSPLLDRTRHGIIFRDEPTETLVEQTYGSQLHLLNDVAARLTRAQASSVYAARSLPGLLFAMGRVDELRKLAFDTRFPAALASDVAKRTIRLNRLRTALGAAAQARDYDAMVDLLVELSSVVAVDERGQDYLLAHPDLVVGLGDSEALRRLFETKTQWPGTRHARLATAYATAGDTPEAYTQAKRADEWARWLRGHKEQRFQMQFNTEDFVGVATYLVASGRTTAAAQYLSQWTDAYSYEAACRLFEICKVSHALGKLPKLREVLKSAARCGRLPPAIGVAMMTVFPDLDVAAGQRLLRRLTKALPRHPPVSDHFPEYGKSDSYSLGLQRCSLRAVHLGLGAEATSILGFVAPRRFGLWALRDPFSTQYVLPWVLCVAVRAVAESRAATLFDCLPSEIWELVSGEPTPDSNAGQRALLEKKLREKPAQNADSDKEKKPQLSESDRQQARDRLPPRILPVVDLANQLAAMVRAKDDGERAAALASFFEGWKAALTAAQEDYYYPKETARYLDNLYSRCALHALIALNMFTPQAGAALIEWIQRSEFVSSQLCIDLVEYFALHEKTATPAGRIAAETVKAIEAEDDVQYRSNLLARLARALLPANRAEATALFSRGLSELDAIGSGDQSFTNELLKFASSLAAKPLRSETAHRLAKICELNLYDSRKFAWPLAAAGFSRIWGANYLAQIARWHDRGKVDLELTLPCTLSSLVRDRFIYPQDAVGLLRLVTPVESWDWGWQDLIESFIEAAPADIAALLDEVLTQFELAYPRRPPASTLKKMREVLERSPAALASVKDQLERLEARATQPRRVERENARHDFSGIDLQAARKTAEEKEQQIDAAVERTDPLSMASIEALAAELDEIDGALDVKSSAFSKLREKVGYVDQSRHIEAVVSARNVKLFAKNELLNGIKADWLASSPSQLDDLKSLGTRLVREHASELVGKEWGFSWELNELSQITGHPREDLAVGLVEAATTRELDTAATTWLNLASILAGRADQKVPRDALKRLLDSGAARLANDVGDGAWKPAFDAGSDQTAIVVGFVRFCLGSPEAANRWRAAHAVRTLARFGRWQVIDALFDRFDAPDAGAFQDLRLPFFAMHSRQWFLLAIARIAMDFPAEIAHHAKKLKAIAFDEAFPHVALREAARRALLACLSGDKSRATQALRRCLDEIHVSTFPPSKMPAKDSPDFHWNRPKDVPEPQPPFRFDYEFDKYDLASIANIFGLPKWEVGDRCVAWIRKWDPKIEHMHEFGGRDHPSGYSIYATGAGDSFQSYGAYLARHALALEAGRLLLTTPIKKAQYTYDRWEEWLSHYSPTRQDGLWLADGTGKHPDFSLHDLKAEGSDGKERPSEDPVLHSLLAGINEDGRIGAFLTVDGSWSSPDGVHVAVSSVLVPTGDTAVAARALATAPLTHMWLPTFEYDDDEYDNERRHYSDMAPVEPWITRVQAELKIDKRDPSGCWEAIQRARPAKHIIKAFNLSAQKPWGDAWLDPASRAVFRSLAWGEHEGQGEHETSDSGSALLCERAFLLEMLTALDRNLIVLVKLQHYRERSRFAADNESTGAFSYAYSALSLNHHLEVTRIVPTRSDLGVIEGLGEQARYEFRHRLRAIKSASRKSEVNSHGSRTSARNT